MRVVQPAGERGSLKWLQSLIEKGVAGLDEPILRALPGSASITWLSPLKDDDFAEYRDDALLDILDLASLKPAMYGFWPRRGPQWDAVGKTDAGHVLLVEAKAHINEFLSPPTSARGDARVLIKSSLEQVARSLSSPYADRWSDQFYQYANRIAHLWFMREHGVNAKLILVGFLGDDEMNGPSQSETWEAVYRIADHVLGIPPRNHLRPHIIHIFPRVANID